MEKELTLKLEANLSAEECLIVKNCIRNMLALYHSVHTSVPGIQNAEDFHKAWDDLKDVSIKFGV